MQLKTIHITYKSLSILISSLILINEYSMAHIYNQREESESKLEINAPKCFEDGKNALIIANAAYKSLKNGKVINVKF